MKRLFIILGLGVLTLGSCVKNRPDTGGTTTEKMANEWYVQLFLPNGSPAYAPDYHGRIATYNTSANDNQIWIDDFPHISGTSWTGDIYAFRFKAQADLSNMTFSATKSPSELKGFVGTTPVNYIINVNVTDGKVIPDGGRSKTGVTTDSIYMKIEFSDDPGTIYTLKGHGRTRFAEDDY